MSKGSILIYTSAAGQAAPLPGVTLTVTDAGGSVRARLATDADGIAEAAYRDFTPGDVVHDFENLAVDIAADIDALARLYLVAAEERRQQWGILHNGGNPDAATPRE